MKKEGLKITGITVALSLVLIVGIIIAATSMAERVNSMKAIDPEIKLPENEKLVDYTVEDGRLYYSTAPMTKKYEPKEYKVYVDGTQVSTIIETKK